MDSYGQLITLQFGTVSNWTGAHFWNLQDELHGLADRGADAASSRFDGRVLYDETSSSSSASSSLFTPRLLSFDEPDALGPGLLSSSSSFSARRSATTALDDDVALAASAATWGGRAVGVPGGGGGAPSAFAAALAAAEEREERRRRRQGGRGAPSSSSFYDDDDDGSKLASAAGALSLSGGVSSWADFLKAPLASEGTVHSFKARGWQQQQQQQRQSSALPSVPGARRPGWGPPPEDDDSQHASAAAGSSRLVDAVEEGARRLAERCDRLGGFLTFADDARGWGSSAAAAQALLRDEYARSPRLLFALRPPDSLFGARAGAGKAAAGSSSSGVASFASAAAAAFSTGALAPLVDVFVPLAPPSGLWSSAAPAFSSPCDALFRWSAAAAAAIDAATTPLRLLRAEAGAGGGGEEEGRTAPSSSSSSSSLAVGGLGAASLAALLAGPRGGPLAALSAALPLSAVPETGEAAERQQRQHQQQQQRGEGRGRGSIIGSPLWASPPAVSCWTPRRLLKLHEEEERGAASAAASLLFAEGSLLAESVTVRGALSSPQCRRRLPAREAASALEAALAAEGARAVRHLCASSAPLHLPLPFPVGMLPSWCYEGVRSKRGGGREGREEEEGFAGAGAPALVRLAASRALSSLAADSADFLTLGPEEALRKRRSSPSSQSHASGLRSSRAGASSSSQQLAGALLPLFDSWGVGAADDAAAAAEAARALAEEYRGGGSDGVLSSCDDDDDEDC